MGAKDTLELVVNAGLQAIPYVGGPLATLYFGYKQEQRFQRIEKVLKEVAEELKEKSLPTVEMHNRDELMALIDELTDTIENENLEYKRNLYKEYFKGILLTPTKGNYEERKLILDVLKLVTPLQIEIFQFVMKNPGVVDMAISKPDIDKSVIRSSILQLENYGLIIGNVYSITVGGDNGGIPMALSISEFGRKFHAFCLTNYDK